MTEEIKMCLVRKDWLIMNLLSRADQSKAGQGKFLHSGAQLTGIQLRHSERNPQEQLRRCKKRSDRFSDASSEFFDDNDDDDGDKSWRTEEIWCNFFF